MTRILGLDSSGTEAGVCILDNAGTLLAEKEIDLGLTHSETLLPLVQEVLATAALTPADIGLYAVSAGPGSFTGLRIGMALAKGMALPGNTPLAPVSTLRALALAFSPAETCWVIPALNARRGEVYWAGFEAKDSLEQIAPDAAGPAATLDPLLAKTRHPIFFVGSGAEICYNEYKGKYDVRQADLPAPLARGVAIAAREMLAKGLVLPAEQARIDYLRLSQAERNRQTQLDTKEHPT